MQKGGGDVLDHAINNNIEMVSFLFRSALPALINTCVDLSVEVQSTE